MITNRTTIMFRLDWDDEPQETLRTRCLEYEQENGGLRPLHILANQEELESGWWRLYEVDPARVGRECGINTERSLRYIKALLESVASRIGLVLRENEPLEELCIRDLVERVAFVSWGLPRKAVAQKQAGRCSQPRKPSVSKSARNWMAR